MFEKVIEVNSLPSDVENNAIYKINQANPNNYTHGIFKYPCRFIPEIPRWAIKTYLGKEDKNIIDPFAGSGTSLLEGIILGFDSYGTEIDPLAKKIIKAKTTQLDKNSLSKIEMEYDRFKSEERYFKNTESYIPQINNLRHWFNEDAIHKLSKIKKFYIEHGDQEVRNFFEMVFASIIKRCSNADDTSPKPYVSSKIQKDVPDVYSEFDKIFERHLEMYKEFMFVDLNNSVKILDGDALQFESDELFDLAITSPPYINAFDYARILRLENLWLDNMTENMILDSKKNYVGTETIRVDDEEKTLEVLDKSDKLKILYHNIKNVDKKRALIVKRFFEDMDKNLIYMNKKLKRGARYVIVIGDSNIRKQKVESWKILADMALENGYFIEGHFGYLIQNPYLRIPRKGKGGKIEYDHVLILRRE